MYRLTGKLVEKIIAKERELKKEFGKDKDGKEKNKRISIFIIHGESRVLTRKDGLREKVISEFIKLAENFDELKALISNFNIYLEGSHEAYTPDELIRRVEKVESGRASPEIIPRAAGLRNKVKELLRKEGAKHKRKFKYSYLSVEGTEHENQDRVAVKEGKEVIIAFAIDGISMEGANGTKAAEEYKRIIESLDINVEEIEGKSDVEIAELIRNKIINSTKEPDLLISATFSGAIMFYDKKKRNYRTIFIINGDGGVGFKIGDYIRGLNVKVDDAYVPFDIVKHIHPLGNIVNTRGFISGKPYASIKNGEDGERIFNLLVEGRPLVFELETKKPIQAIVYTDGLDDLCINEYYENEFDDLGKTKEIHERIIRKAMDGSLTPSFIKNSLPYPRDDTSYVVIEYA